MFDRSEIRAAVEAGILTRDQATRLEAFLAHRADPVVKSAAGSDENLRFLNNFNDIFITIGIVILAMGLTAITGLFFGPQFWSMVTGGNAGAFGAVILMPVAGVMWLLAEYFGGRRRMLLPSMAAITIFTLYSGLSVGMIASGLTGANAETVTSLTQAWSTVGNTGIGTFLGCGGAAALAWLRFRLPFCMFLMAVSAAAAAYTFAGFFGNAGLVIGGLLSILIGLVTLTAAIWFDQKDPGRITRLSDNAFWLHVAAAPQIILGLRGMIMGAPTATPSTFEALILLACLAGLGLLSLALNRRALVVSSLLSFWLALGQVVEAVGGGGGGTNTFIATTLLLGTGIIALGGGWHTARRWVLGWVPQTGLAARIFPPEPA
ncbi:MAG: hypothetical protein FP825_01635 [Hyphomonas sp.]|uniref:hypothetical protein n=1 Tax=Hyphomonas sp. TaxID=87 RepID=UPI0017E2CD2E|nr:hypothetical protein [Hyphomonas sp.]MBA3067166.1 hypothetical protein [Hyphomonas sp.]MBU4061224.1 hypothetical protein [Alphaproteobacteria bacterium]MBU4165136.1 hypothetical protein [Alphaproteobacteria bacterium]MBU4567617.1 hypothetical protein [Alphaproteobacteria bacterium]